MSDDLNNILAGLDIQEADTLLFELDKDSYIERPVSIETFLSDSDFLGDVIGREIYPFWRNHLTKLFPTTFYSPYSEVILSLPIGSGKTTLSNISILYEIHKLLCLKSPQTFYKVYPAGLGIAFVLFSSVKYLADDVNWKGLQALMVASPWFSKNITGLKLDRESMSVHVGKGVYIQLGSSSMQALGRAIFGGVMDEANFSRSRTNAVGESYSAILRRMESRFLQPAGNIPGKLFLISSPRYATDFLSERMEASRNTRRTYVVRDVPIWDLHRGSRRMDNYSGRTFPLFLGSETKDPVILAKEGIIEGYNVIQVPTEYYDAFETDLFSAIRDIAGYPVHGAISLFRSVEKILRMSVVPNKFTKDIIDLDFKDNFDTVSRYADMEYFKNPTHPEAYRFIHIDIGLKNDRLGMAAVYALFENPLLGGLPVDEEGIPIIHEIRDRRFYMDWILYVQAKPGDEIPIYKIRDWILGLRTINYPIAKITADQFQSSDLRQQLRLQGLDVECISVDRTKDAYHSLKNAINNERIFMINHPLLIKELRELREDDRKIDHPENGSKDGSDAVAGAFWSCLSSNTIMNQLLLQKQDETGGLGSILKQGLEQYQNRKRQGSWATFFGEGNSW